MSYDHLDWPRLSYREQFKEEDEEADRGKLVVKSTVVPQRSARLRDR